MVALGLTWGLAHALSMRAHVRINLLINKLPADIRYWMHLASLLALGFSSGSWRRRVTTWSMKSILFRATDTSVLHIPLAIPQVCGPWGWQS